MTRTMGSAKKAGASFERAVADWLRVALGDDRVDRRARSGAKDRGDVAGVRAHGRPVVIECKNYVSEARMAQWLREAEAERGNDDALAGVVVHKVAGAGMTPASMGRQRVTMTLRDFAALILGDREEVEANLEAKRGRVAEARERVRAIGPDLDEFDDQEDE